MALRVDPSRTSSKTAKIQVTSRGVNRSRTVALLILVATAAALNTATSRARGQPPADHPAVTVRGQTYTPRSISARNMGTPEDQTTQFPPHKVIANVYYVGTRTLSSFLIVTPQGHILLDSTYERNVPTIEKSVSDLGSGLPTSRSSWETTRMRIIRRGTRW